MQTQCGIIRGDWVLTNQSLKPARSDRQPLPGGTLGHVLEPGINHFVKVDFGDLGVMAVPAANLIVLDLPDLAQSAEDMLVEELATLIAAQREIICSLQTRLDQAETESQTLSTTLEQERAALAAAEEQLEQLRASLGNLLTPLAPTRLSGTRHADQTTEFEEQITLAQDCPEGEGWIYVEEVTNPETGEVIGHRWLRELDDRGNHECC